jgi:hypothetical protein
MPTAMTKLRRSTGCGTRRASQTPAPAAERCTRHHDRAPPASRRRCPLAKTRIATAAITIGQEILQRVEAVVVAVLGEAEHGKRHDPHAGAEESHHRWR